MYVCACVYKFTHSSSLIYAKIIRHASQAFMKKTRLSTRKFFNLFFSQIVEKHSIILARISRRAELLYILKFIR